MKTKILISLIALIGLIFSKADAKELFVFNGRANFADNTFDVNVDFQDDSSIKAKGVKASDEDYRLTLDIEHVKSPFFELSSQIESSLSFGVHNQEGDQQAIFGKLSSQYSLVDYKPIDELSGRFEIKDNRIYFTSLEFARVAWNGFVEFVDPFAIGMVVTIDSMPMERFLDFWVKKNDFDSSGIVSGEIRLSGTLTELKMKGNLQAYNGHIEGLNYDNIHLNATGVYPNIEVQHTVISKSDGLSFSVDGPVDISDQDNFKKQIMALKMSPLVSDTVSKTEWTIKRVKGMEAGATEFKYLLRKDEPTSSSAEESVMLGVEQKLEF